MSDPVRSGILIVEKGPGFTSFQVVAHLRRRLKAAKVGHGGTLDPGATGVLPILIGEATKLTPYLIDHDKEYLATVRLGVVTDTQDLTGRVLKTFTVPSLSDASLREVCASFVGTIRQIPPMFSAIHHGGERLYALARKGVEVQRPARQVAVHVLTVESIALPSFTIRLTCGRGTYVRTLCADIGERLGCGGALESLIRTRVGPFGLAEAVPWSEVKESDGAGKLWASVLPLDAGLGHWPAVSLADDETAALLRGKAVSAPAAARGLAGWVRLYRVTGQFLGVGRVVGRECVKPVRIFHGDLPRHRSLPA